MRVHLSKIFLPPLLFLLSAHASAFEGIETVLRITNSACTATLVGPNVMVTAAHCVADETVSIEFGPRAIGVHCTAHPGPSPQGRGIDFALCLTPDIQIGLENYESFAPVGPADNEVSLVGYGCSGSFGDDLFRVGDINSSTIGAPESGLPTYVGSAVLCPGDSGGPVFFQSDRELTSRQIIGVKSRSGLELDGGDQDLERGIIAATATANAREFISDWATMNNVTVCGINASDDLTCNGYDGSSSGTGVGTHDLRSAPPH